MSSDKSSFYQTQYYCTVITVLSTDGFIQTSVSCVVRTGVGEPGLDEFVEQLVGDGVSGLVVSGHPLQRLLLPNPVLQHLRRSLHKVPLHMSPTEHGVVRLQTQIHLSRTNMAACSFQHKAVFFFSVKSSGLSTDLGTELVHDVAELVEVRLHLVVLQERRSVGRRLAEVGHHGRHRHLPRAVGQQAAGLEAETGGVTVLPLPAQDRYDMKTVRTPED